MFTGLEYLSHEDRLRELALFSLENRIFQGNLTAAFQYLMGAYRKNRKGLFIRMCCDRTRDNGFNLKRVPFRLGIREKLFIQRVVRHWKWFPREVVYALSLEAF